MARRSFASVKELLPQVLSQLSENSGDARGLGTLWHEAVGQAISRNAHPREIRNGVLTLEAVNGRWARELADQEEALLLKLNAWGRPWVRKLHFVSSS